MKKTAQLRYLVLFAIAVSSTAAAETFSQKTYFSPRPAGVNRAMEYTTWHELEFGHTKAPSKSAIHSHIALTSSYQESQKSAEMGKYFGIGNGKNSFRVDKTNAPTVPVEVINGLLIHYAAQPNDSTLNGTIAFNPKQEIWGIRLDYFQDVDHPFKKFFFKASLPIVHVQNDMGMKISNDQKLTPRVADVATMDNKTFSLQDFFNGSINITHATNKQLPLTKAKIAGRRTVNGLADLNLALGYKLHTSPQNHLYFNAGILIPTESKKRGDYLFEPHAGNGGHTGFTAGIDGGVTLWTSKAKEASVRLLGSLDYRYLFESTEYRTPALKDSFFPAAEKGKLNPYYIGREIGSDHGYPAANLFTQGLKIKPGSQGETLIDLSFKCSGFVIDLGYNAFYKEKESVWLKNDFWKTAQFVIVPRDLSMANPTTTIKTGAAVTATDITASDFDMEAVTNPSQFTHKIFGGLGYTFPMAKKYPTTIGFGASYEFASDNAAMEAMALWFKTGISF